MQKVGNGEQGRSKYQQSKLDEIKQKAPEMWEVMKVIKKRFGSFTIKRLRIKDE